MQVRSTVAVDPTGPAAPIDPAEASTFNIPRAPASDNSRPFTTLGSPLSSAWDPADIAFVEAREAELNGRICGARTLSGVPCSLAPNHENGRCK